MNNVLACLRKRSGIVADTGDLDTVADEKLSDGIRKFDADARKLESVESALSDLLKKRAA